MERKKQVWVKNQDGSDEQEMWKRIDYENSSGPGNEPLFCNAELSGETKGVPDVAALGYLHEPAILANAKARFFFELPYWYCGSKNICVAVNPYKWLTHLYTDDVARSYFSDETDSLPPHCFATSAAAYSNLFARSQRDQSILVSGESGAGKTETAKIVMNHLSLISGDGTPVVKRVLESNPILESFGNAATLRNDNSSRFGKFTRLEFSRRGKLVGATIQTYLLEKNRVTMQASGERGFHIFYQLMTGAGYATPESKEKDELDVVGRAFRYLENSRDSINGVDDAESCKTTVAALGVLGIDRDTLDSVFSTLAAILWLGEMEIAPSQDGEGSTVPNDAVALHVASLLGCQKNDIIACLTMRKMVTRGETFKVPLKAGAAADVRDALAQAIYAKLFSWIVARINSATKPEEMYRKINVLDIFGFEHFEENGYEQLCINFANESLQQKFTHDVFKSLQQEYESEGINMEKVAFEDNADVLDLFEARLGVLSLLDEECFRPKGKASAFVSKLLTLRGDDSNLFKERFQDCQFGIKHYAGSVVYDASLFLAKNQDALKPDVIATMEASENSFIQGLFCAKPAPSKKSNRASIKRRSSINSITVGGQFKKQLRELRSTVDATETHYVRCIKPNPVMSSSAFDDALVTEQLRCAGLIQAVQISRATYPNKMAIEDCMSRFGVLLPGKAAEGLSGLLLDLLRGESVPETPFEIGKSIVYFAANVLEKLEAQRLHCFGAHATKIQSYVRRFVAQSKYVKLRAFCVKLQSVARAHAAREHYTRVQRLAVCAQRIARGRAARKRARFIKFNVEATKIQSLIRMRSLRKTYFRTITSCVRIQSIFRKKLAEKHSTILREEKEKQASLQGQMEELQNRLNEERRLREEAEAISAQSVIIAPPTPAAPMILSPDRNLMRDTTSLISKLREEIADLQKANEKLTSKNELLHTQLRKTKESYSRASSSFAMLNKSFKKVAKRLKEAKKIDVEQKARIKALRCSVAISNEEALVAKKLYKSELTCRMKLEKLVNERSKSSTVGAIATSPITSGAPPPSSSSTSSVGILAALTSSGVVEQGACENVASAGNQSVLRKRGGGNNNETTKREKLKTPRKVAAGSGGLSIFLRWL